MSEARTAGQAAGEDPGANQAPRDAAPHRLSLLYHELRPAGSGYSYVLACERFEQHAALFEEGGHGWLPEITFDDGHISNYEYALPVLSRRRMSASFFITVGWTGQKAGYMGWEELRAMHAAGQRIGAHGWSHALLTHCTPRELDDELRRARLVLEDKLGVRITTMSLPGGRYDRRVLAACAAAGYGQVFTSVPRAEAGPGGFLVGRLNVRGDATVEWLERLLDPESGLLDRLGRSHRLKQSAKRLLGDRLYARLWAAVNRQEPQ